jgi:hypothetical protein
VTSRAEALALPQRQQLGLHVRGQRIELAQGLVQHQQAGVVDDGARQRHALAPCRPRAGAGRLGEVLQPTSLSAASTRGCALRAARLRAQGHVVAHVRQGNSVGSWNTTMREDRAG